MIGKDLNLDHTIKDTSWRCALNVAYENCTPSINPSVLHNNYKLDSLKDAAHQYAKNNLVWLCMATYCLSQMRADESPTSHNEVEASEVVNSMSFGVAVPDYSPAIPEDSPVIVDQFHRIPELAPTIIDEHDVPVINDKKKLSCPTWSGFNSLIHEETSQWNVGILAPLYRRSPTEYPVLFTILKHAQKLNVLTVGEGKRPIITLDGDLYDRAVKIENYKKHWIIRLGGLHTVMAALKCLGKYMDGSGIDSAWEASGVYGSATVRQILEGRHIYRGLEAHIVTLVAIFAMFMDITLTQTEKNSLNEQMKVLLDDVALKRNDNDKRTEFKTKLMQFISSPANRNLLEKLISSKSSCEGISKFLINYF